MDELIFAQFIRFFYNSYFIVIWTFAFIVKSTGIYAGSLFFFSNGEMVNLLLLVLISILRKGILLLVLSSNVNLRMELVFGVYIFLPFFFLSNKRISSTYLR